MPNRTIHSIAGAVAGGIGAILITIERDNPAWDQRAFAGALGGFIGSGIADYVDPPTSYRHRSIGHSLVLCAVGSAVLFAAASRLESSSNPRRISEEPEEPVSNSNQAVWASILRGLAIGHISHLALDAGSPMGISL